MYLTFSDVLDHLLEFVQAHAAAPPSVIRRAVIRAYDEVIHAHEWTFLRGTYRVHCHAAQTAGTVDYDNTTRIVTLTGATWPTWAATASLYLDDVVCDVESWTDNTHLVLTRDANPGVDVNDGEYTLFPRWYQLPSDLLEMADPLGESAYQLGQLISWDEMTQQHRWLPATGDLKYWAIGPSPSGGQALFVYPALDEDVRIDLPYRKRPRDLRHTGQDAADIAGTITVSGTAVTGSSTTFAKSMEGSILRVGASTSVPPTGLEGNTPWAEELVIDTVSSSTALTTTTSGTPASGKKYRVSCPIDVGRVAWEAVLCCAEKHLARMRNYENYRQIEASYTDALRRAKAADSPEQPRRVAGRVSQHYIRLKDLQ